MNEAAILATMRIDLAKHSGEASSHTKATVRTAQVAWL